MSIKKLVAIGICLVLLFGLAGLANAEKLKYGDAGAQVVMLQSKLTSLAFYTGVIDGKYGYQTYLAVKAFQASVGLKADGIAGPLTLEKLNAVPMPPDPSISSLKYGDSGLEVEALQRRLYDLGYLVDGFTGVFDDLTLGAVIAFQKRNKLPQDGVVSGATKALMDSNTAFGLSIDHWANGHSIIRLQYGDMGDGVREVQELLYNLNYLNVKDGVYGYSTTQAVRKFQKNNGQKSDGIIGPLTLKVLMGPGAMPNP